MAWACLDLLMLERKLFFQASQFPCTTPENPGGARVSCWPMLFYSIGKSNRLPIWRSESIFSKSRREFARSDIDLALPSTFGLAPPRAPELCCSDELEPKECERELLSSLY